MTDRHVPDRSFTDRRTTDRQVASRQARLDLSVPSHIHVVGIGGAGMSAIATVLQSMGHAVSGSDLKDSPLLDRLRARAIAVQIGHRASNVEGADYVTVSSAIPPNNVECQHARSLGIPVLSRAEVLAAITQRKKTITVAGTHGKTTTSSMLSLILVEAGLRPSFVVGGEVNEIGTNAAWSNGDWFVVEADESDGTFLELSSEVAILTNLEADHLDHYGSLASLTEAFATYLRGARRGSVVCADDSAARALAGPASVTYGFSDAAEVRIVGFAGGRSQIAFSLERGGRALGRFELPVPGEHNARNAAAALVAASELGVSLEAAQRALARFAVARRFEFRGEKNGVTFVDDYAHLPGEVQATLAAAKVGGWKRVVCVFQPHRYSRIASLWQDFAEAFVDADALVLTDIYAAGEAPRPGVSARLILDAVLSAHPDTPVAYLPGRADLLDYLRSHLRPGDCCLSLGAGDLTTLPGELLAEDR